MRLRSWDQEQEFDLYMRHRGDKAAAFVPPDGIGRFAANSQTQGRAGLGRATSLLGAFSLVVGACAGALLGIVSHSAG
jgi:hypothetical protein